MALPIIKGERVYLQIWEARNGLKARIHIYIDDEKIGHLVSKALRNKDGTTKLQSGAFTLKAEKCSTP